MPKIIAKKQDWINLGFKLFSEKGISGVIIEKMAKKLNVNKSSFYWHFKTKKEFIQQLIEFWISNETEQIIYLTNNEKSAVQKFKTLIKLSYKKMPQQDFIFYLKRYAEKEKKTKFIIEKIDSQRIEFVNRLLREMGYSEHDANIKSSLLYKHLIGYHEMIRYEKQSTNYQMIVKQELNQFIEY
ncbi:TetR/AcrR family transcriptional regulator [Maribacter forsetii]|uniref:TetR/AcrR family transcriptional regulator n=1 Tax=Maribacter forsetii TaxID=444515 RepID=UPI00055EEE2A|nr:TetR/AcrR family transcriptional regulator [Maribacter forsetii]